MSLPGPAFRSLLIVTFILMRGASATSPAQQKNEPGPTQLPTELRGAKIYHFPDAPPSGKAAVDPVIYKKIAYEDINFDRLLLDLELSIKPVDRAATVEKVYFQNFRVGGIPVHVETFAQEFKLSKTEAVDLPIPLKCSIVFSDLESLGALQDFLNQDHTRITGQSFIEVKLNALEKLALRTKQLVLPVELNEEVPLDLFSSSPWLRMAASKVLGALSDPSTTAAARLAQEHLARLTEARTLSSLGPDSLYLVYCEYVLRDPRTQATEKFSQSGTGFVVGPDGKILTAKRVVQPWKFDPQIAFLIGRYHLELDTKSVKMAAWPGGAQVLGATGQLDFGAARSTDRQTLRLLKTAPDRMQSQDYRDPDSGESARVSVHAPGQNDLAVLQLTGNHFHALALAEEGSEIRAGQQSVVPGLALLAFAFGLSQPQADPHPIFVHASLQGPLLVLDHQLNPGESGAPLLNREGKVLALAASGNECIPIENVRGLIP